MRQIHRSILHYCYLQDCSSPRHWNTSCFHRLYTNHGTYNKLNIISYLQLIVGSTRLFWYPEMINLEIFNIKFLEITALSIGYKLSPTVCPIFCRVLLICQLLFRLYHGVVRRVEEKWKREPFLLWVHHHPVLHTLIPVIAPNLKTFPFWVKLANDKSLQVHTNSNTGIELILIGLVIIFLIHTCIYGQHWEESDILT